MAQVAQRRRQLRPLELVFKRNLDQRADAARHPRTTLRYFDTEAYSAWCSDVMMWNVADPVVASKRAQTVF